MPLVLRSTSAASYQLDVRLRSSPAPTSGDSFESFRKQTIARGLSSSASQKCGRAAASVSRGFDFLPDSRISGSTPVNVWSSANFVVGKDYGGCTHSCCRVRTMGNGQFHLVLGAYLVAGRTTCSQPKLRRGLAISCSVTVPVPNEHSPLDNQTRTKSSEASKDSSSDNDNKTSAREPIKAAFFDVDGTITRTNVVLAFLSVRMTEMSFMKKLVWLPWFAVCCIVYLFVDHFHRPTFNRLFYLNYKGRPADGKVAMANLIYERYYKPRILAGAVEQIQELKKLGYHIVLVTGALDFQIAPLARELGADYVYAAKLVEENGRFTGEMNGMATSNSEKAERVWDYAKRYGVSLRDSLAFGDSIADLDMLEIVGRPHAVNPDARLQAIALNRGWAILRWYARRQKTAAPVSVPAPA